MDVGETVHARNRDEWRRWLAMHHADKKEIWLVYYKKASGKTGVSYDESVEEALAYGWIDGTNKSIDEHTYAGRFTPRRPRSTWSESNIARVKKLLAAGRMAPPGLAVLPDSLRPDFLPRSPGRVRSDSLPRSPGRVRSDSLPRSRGRVREGA